MQDDFQVLNLEPIGYKITNGEWIRNVDFWRFSQEFDGEIVDMNYENIEQQFEGEFIAYSNLNYMVLISVFTQYLPDYPVWCTNYLCNEPEDDCFWQRWAERKTREKYAWKKGYHICYFSNWALAVRTAKFNREEPEIFFAALEEEVKDKKKRMSLITKKIIAKKMIILNYLLPIELVRQIILDVYGGKFTI